MKIKYKFANGETCTVEAGEDVGTLILEDRRREANLNRMEQYHSAWSIDGALYEGEELSDGRGNGEHIVLEELRKRELAEALMTLTEPQRRRLLLYAEGLTEAQIGAREGVSQQKISKSIGQARKKLKIILQ